MPLRLERREMPIRTVEEWFLHARPMGGEIQWRDGRSAKELAKAWCGDGDGPAPPGDLLRLLATRPALANLEFEVGYPEHRIRFDGVPGEPRNADLAVACLGPGGRVALSIEAKADEVFGRTVGEEIVNAAAQWAFEERDGKLERLRLLANAILPRYRAGHAKIGQLRYQLLTAIAGAWAFASEVQASVAVLVVHEFLSSRLNAVRLAENHQDLARLVVRVSDGRIPALEAGALIGPMQVPASPSWPGVVDWYLGKCQTSLV